VTDEQVGEVADKLNDRPKNVLAGETQARFYPIKTQSLRFRIETAIVRNKS